MAGPQPVPLTGEPSHPPELLAKTIVRLPPTAGIVFYADRYYIEDTGYWQNPPRPLLCSRYSSFYLLTTNKRNVRSFVRGNGCAHQAAGALHSSTRGCCPSASGSKRPPALPDSKALRSHSRRPTSCKVFWIREKTRRSPYH